MKTRLELFLHLTCAAIAFASAAGLAPQICDLMLMLVSILLAANVHPEP